LIEKQSARIVGEVDSGKNDSSIGNSLVQDEGSKAVEDVISEHGAKSPTLAGVLSTYKRFDISLLLWVASICLLSWILNLLFCFFFTFFF
jgi:hypothetical protein